ncbi:hypothetical protein QE152_g4623 [Popillia japonica]|uniref:Uncharacterized protein n=1 Tax=Popillia japonica TaxID=7064 RepID=A0AAW1MU27_POPJA
MDVNRKSQEDEDNEYDSQEKETELELPNQTIENSETKSKRENDNFWFFKKESVSEVLKEISVYIEEAADFHSTKRKTPQPPTVVTHDKRKTVSKVILEENEDKENGKPKLNQINSAITSTELDTLDGKENIENDANMDVNRKSQEDEDNEYDSQEKETELELPNQTIENSETKSKRENDNFWFFKKESVSEVLKEISVYIEEAADFHSTKRKTPQPPTVVTHDKRKTVSKVILEENEDKENGKPKLNQINSPITSTELDVGRK